MFKESREAEIGVVVRNSQGLFLVSMKEKILILHSVSDVEVMVVVRAFKFRSRSPSFIHYFRG